MTFALPAYSGGSATGWALQDYKPDLTLTTKPATGGSGTMQVTSDFVPAGLLWSIQRAVVSSTSTGGATESTFRLYDSQVTPASLLSGTDTGDYDEADYPNGLLLGEGRQLVAVWSGATDGAVGTIRLQIAVLGRSA